MNHVKTLLLWLLLAALPMQGYAAVSPFMGMPGQMASALALALAPAPAAASASASAPAPAPAPASMMAPRDHAAAPQQLAASAHCVMHAQAERPVHHAHCSADAAKAKCGNCGNCGNCASCCVGAAIAVPVPAQALAGFLAIGSEAIPYRHRHATAHIPGGLERPPHSDLA